MTQYYGVSWHIDYEHWENDTNLFTTIPKAQKRVMEKIEELASGSTILKRDETVWRAGVLTVVIEIYTVIE